MGPSTTGEDELRVVSRSLPTISVVTVCLNSKQTIRKTVESVVGQNYGNIEYIIVDGASTDGTLDILAGYGGSIDRLISEPDDGIYDAMNKGIAAASGDWIHILNSDDYYSGPEILSAAAPMLDKSRTNYFQIWREFEDGRLELQDWRYNRSLLFLSAFLPHPGLMVSREQYETVGLYDTRYRVAADHDMILRLTRRWPGLKHDHPLTVMRQGGYSEKNMADTLGEFKQISIRNGFPALFAGAVLSLKRVWWGQ